MRPQWLFSFALISISTFAGGAEPLPKAVPSSAPTDAATQGPPSSTAASDDDGRWAGGAQDLLNSRSNHLAKPANDNVLNTGFNAYQKAKDAINSIRNPQVTIPVSE